MRTELCLFFSLPRCGHVTTTYLPAVPNPEDSGSQGAKGGTALCERERPEGQPKASSSVDGVRVESVEPWGDAAGASFPPAATVPATPSGRSTGAKSCRRHGPLLWPHDGVLAERNLSSQGAGSERTTSERLPSLFLADPCWPRSLGVPESLPSRRLRQRSACHREEAGPLSTCGCVLSAHHTRQEDPRQQTSCPRKPLLP